jgi:hypothetical protein
MRTEISNVVKNTLNARLVVKVEHHARDLKMANVFLVDLESVETRL